jgi:membrane protein
MGAALAFYSLLSISPLVVLVVAIAGEFIDRSVVLRELTGQFQYLLGLPGATALNAMLVSAQANSAESTKASIISVITLFIGASAVFAELRSDLDTIWEVAPSPDDGLWEVIRKRLLSVVMVIAIAFLLLASLVFSAALSATSAFLLNMMPLQKLLAQSLDFVVSLIGVAALFAMTFRLVPDAPVKWRQAWIGGGLTAVLFTAGKYFIGTYLTRAAVSSAYGAAGSIVVVIIWVYYTAQIFFFGAEFTRAIGEPPGRG